MNTKMPAIAAGCMIALMALAPLGLAHDDTGQGSDNEPSGVYVGPAGVFFRGFDGMDDLGNDTFGATALCDLEVASDGDAATAEDNDADEPFVDGDAANVGLLGPQQNEGDWDDGGFGALCHTPSTHYVNNGQDADHPQYNSQYCDFGAGELATADDALLPAGGVNGPWLVTTCDFLSVVRDADGQPTVDVLVLNLVGCELNAVLTVSATGVVACLDLFLDCLVGGNLLMNGDDCPVQPGDDVACGPDGTSDTFEAGPGDPGVPYAPYAPCESEDGVATTFVFDAVVVDSDADDDPLTNDPSVTLYGATTGSVY